METEGWGSALEGKEGGVSRARYSEPHNELVRELTSSWDVVPGETCICRLTFKIWVRVFFFRVPFQSVCDAEAFGNEVIPQRGLQRRYTYLRHSSVNSENLPTLCRISRILRPTFHISLQLPVRKCPLL